MLDVLKDPRNVVRATMSSVGFGFSPATGHALMELVMHNACNFADLSTLRLARFGGMAPDWATRRGWVPPVPALQA